jgi:hypothetical protein
MCGVVGEGLSLPVHERRCDPKQKVNPNHSIFDPKNRQ